MEYTTQYTVKQVCDILNVPVPQEYSYMANDVLTSLTFRSHQCTKGGACFIRRKTAEAFAEDIRKAKELGAKVLFLGNGCRTLGVEIDMPHIYVGRAFPAVCKVGASIRDGLGIRVVGVTGSVGKTTTKELIYSVLNEEFRVEKSMGNQNIIAPIFNNLQKLSRRTQVYVQEFGIDIPGVMPRTVTACLPDAGVITNISDPHLDTFKTRENILKEKLHIITQSPEGSPIFLNWDDALLKTVRLDKHPVISYAVENPEADYHSENLQVFDGYMTFDVVHKEKRTPVLLHALGTYNVANALVAFAVGEWFGLSEEKIVRGIEAYRSEGIRQSLTNIGGYQLYIDCYNTAPVSLLGAVAVMERLSVPEGGKRIAVLGDIARLGEFAEKFHRELGEQLGRSKMDLFLCFGNENAQVMAEAIRAQGGNALYTADRNELNEWMRASITKQDITLVKGPVVRLLSKSIDQVFGTSFHVQSEHFDWLDRGDFRVKMIYEKHAHDRKMAALSNYRGSDKHITLPAQCDGFPVFCVGTTCFLRNQTLRQVDIPEPIFNISNGAFRGCRKLHKVTLPSTLKVIGNRAFYYCTSLTEVTLPEGVIDIGSEAFAFCRSLKRITLPASTGRIGEKAFVGCPNLTIRCHRDSFAHRYAQEHGYPVEFI